MAPEGPSPMTATRLIFMFFEYHVLLATGHGEVVE
jgi:hypothetical protein